MIKLKQIEHGEEMLEDVQALLQLLIDPNGADLIGVDLSENNSEENNNS